MQETFRGGTQSYYQPLAELSLSGPVRVQLSSPHSWTLYAVSELSNQGVFLQYSLAFWETEYRDDGRHSSSACWSWQLRR